MITRLKKVLRKLTGGRELSGINVGPIGASWQPGPQKPAYETQDEYLVAASVANEEHGDESFLVAVSIAANSSVADLAERVKFQRAISMSLARTGAPPSKIDPRDIPDPDIFDWGVVQLSYDLPLTSIAHGRIVIAIFDSAVPPAKAAFLTKDAVRQRPEILSYLRPRNL